MKKKIVIFLLAVFLVFALLVSALCFFAPKKNQNSRENTTEQPKTEDTAEQTEKEKREQYHFTNLEYIYYINSENETDFEEQAAEYVEKNYKNVQWINALSKYDDDVSSNAGTATFYLQLDDDDKYPYGKPQTDEVARGSGNREYGCRRLREKLPNFSGVSF
ncbi:hypothetical protein, partial [Anaerobutyricum hallii]|uniref:hypothetical protein n=1 Tax=Anaerobutyricum hallii TaxID=39488 RepID=UPI003AB59C86